MNSHEAKLTVVGAGAIGGLLAARLARAGQPVNVIARGAHLAAIRAHGLKVIEPEQEYVAQVHATAVPAELGEQDLVLICLKGPALLQALATLTPLIGPHTRIVSVMNGLPWWFLHGVDFDLAPELAPDLERAASPARSRRLESVDPHGSVSAVLPPRQSMGCVVHIVSSLAAPGVIHKGRGRELILGGATAQSGPACDALVALLVRAGFEARASSEIRADIWAKLWGNLTMNPISALTRSSTDVILHDPLTAALAVDLMEEARRVGARVGVALTMTAAARNAQTRTMGAFKTSMLQDLEAGRGLEFEAILGAPYELARRVGEPVPFLGALYGLVRQLDANLAHARAQAVNSG